jgi:hypothetical protein
MTKDNVRHLTTATKPTLPVDDDLIVGIEALLALARKGDIQGIAYVTIRTNGAGHYETVGTGWRGHQGGAHIVLGGLQVLNQRLLAASAEDGIPA